MREKRINHFTIKVSAEDGVASTIFMDRLNRLLLSDKIRIGKGWDIKHYSTEQEWSDIDIASKQRD